MNQASGRQPRRKRVNIDQELLDVAEAELANYAERMRKGLPLGLTLSQIIKFVTLGCELERRGLGVDRVPEFRQIQVIDATSKEP